MAEVNYQRQPTVSVHGLPKDQYDAGGGSVGGSAPVGGPPSTGIMAEIKAHPIWAVSIGIGVIAIAIMIFLWWQNQSGGSSNTSNAIDPNTGQPYALENGNNPSAMYGSQLDADYQEMISLQNQIIGLLNKQQSSSSSGTGTTNPPIPPDVFHWPKKPNPLTPGKDYAGPTGVAHYVTTGNETLSQIANDFGVSNWKQIGGVPTNMKLRGWKYNSGYKPPRGEVINLPIAVEGSSFWSSHEFTPPAS